MIFNQIKDRLYRGLPVFSFEFFPPKTEKGEESLFEALEKLVGMRPDFVSVTYGAGGTTKEKTRRIVLTIKERFKLEVMPHLTCVGHTREELQQMLEEYAQNNITNVLALRGDPPKGVQDWQPVPGGPEHAEDIVRMAHQAGAFSVGVAGFPEKHPEAPDLETDLKYLRAKMDAGADFIITQLIFDNDLYSDYVSKARRLGVTIPIIPGIMPVTKIEQLEKFRELAHCYIPPELEKALRTCVDERQIEEVGLAYCAAQCADLLRRGAPGIHFYTLNQSRACTTIHAALQALGYWGDNR